MPVPRDNDRRLLHFSRNLRKDSTDAERKLWSILRSRQLAGYKFRRQHPIGGFILDFYCVRYRLAVELDGGQHADPETARYDANRTKRLNELGVHILRFWDHDMLKDPDVVAEEILRHLCKEPSPPPSPGVPGEGDAHSPSPGNPGEGRGEGFAQCP